MPAGVQPEPDSEVALAPGLGPPCKNLKNRRPRADAAAESAESKARLRVLPIFKFVRCSSSDSRLRLPLSVLPVSRLSRSLPVKADDSVGRHQ
jgi:hypothetical protein